jgi:hypothetical protein
LLAAAYSHRQTVGWTGALRVLGQSFGTPLLAVLLLGMNVSVWRILQAYLDIDGLGDKPLALAKRVVFAITGIFYSLAALWILWVLFGFAADKREDALLQHWTCWVLHLLFGPWFLAFVGMTVVETGVGLGIRAWTAPLDHRSIKPHFSRRPCL